MSNIKVTVSLPANIFEALDATAKANFRNRSQQIAESLKNDPDVYEVLEGMKNGN